MIERHYFRDHLLKSFDFDFGFCIPNSRNTCEHIYEFPQLSESLGESSFFHSTFYYWLHEFNRNIPCYDRIKGCCLLAVMIFWLLPCHVSITEVRIRLWLRKSAGSSALMWWRDMICLIKYTVFSSALDYSIQNMTPYRNPCWWYIWQYIITVVSICIDTYLYTY